MIIQPFYGYAFELFGRLGPLTLGSLSCACLIWIIPQTSPNFVFLIVIRVLITISNGFLVSSPLIADYVKNESRGSAAALASLGTLIGAAFGLIVLVGGTIGMTLENSFKTVSVIMIILSLLNFFFVREPIIKLPGEKKAKAGGQKELEAQSEVVLTGWDKVVYLTGEVKATLLKDMRYLLSFVAWFSACLV